MFDIASIIAALAVQYPWVMTIFVLVGVLRVVVKPLMEIARNAAAQTPSVKDDEAVAKIEQGKVYKTLVFILDWLTSIKIAPKS